MNRRGFLRFTAAGAVALVLPSRTGFGQGSAARKPNFVFILVDDMGWRDAGCFGSTFYETPHIDRLAREGMRFTDAYAACPVCSPTRASIMTGEYPARLHLTDWIPGRQANAQARASMKLDPPEFEQQLALDEVTLAETLKEAGYATFFAGKWHLGSEGFYPEDQGFDVNKGGWERGGPYGGGRYFSPYGNPKLSDGPEGEHLPDRLATETCRFIESQRDRPFLAYLSFYSVHTPLMAREDLKTKYEAKADGLQHNGPAWGDEGTRKVRLVQDHAVYAGMIEAMDQAVGKVLDALDRLNLTQNTVVLFMSDNGGLSTAEGSPTSNVPLRGGKGWLYEGGIREPMIVRWPGVVKVRAVCHEPVISTDFYPTMLQIAGLPLKPRQHTDGVSLMGLLQGAGGLGRQAIYWHYPHYSNQGGAPGGAVRAGDFKLIEFYEDGRIELYNLRDDIGERHNLVAEMPEKAAELHQMLRAWRYEVGAAMPKPNPRYEG
ncbi:MAG: sulfatase [Sedimentisphaerales bacterium]|nr:sulfatase [Sedimentisphaerales bacterium]